jgi:ELWxxDGT repeat protein
MATFVRTGSRRRRIGTALLVGIALAGATAVHGSNEGPAHLVKNVNQTVDTRGSSRPYGFTALGKFVYFLAEDGESAQDTWRRVLCRTDGTPAGTVALDELGIEIPHPVWLVQFRDQLLVAADDVWITDGTVVGTHVVVSGGIEGLAVAGDAIYFIRDGGLWTSDGSPDGTRVVVQFGEGGDLRYLMAAGDNLYFTGCDPVHGCELWHSDGTAEGTQMVADLAPGPDSGMFDPELDTPYAFFDGSIYFLAYTRESGVELWRSDGSAEGTRQVKDIDPGPSDGFVEAYDFFDTYRAYFTVLDDRLFFIASDGRHGFELWRTDGTTAGTAMVSDLVPGEAGLFDAISKADECDPQFPPTATLDGYLYFVSCWIDEERNAALDLWSSDGTAAGTRLLESGIGGSIAVFDGGLYFARGELNGSRRELRRRDINSLDSTLVVKLDGGIGGLHAFADGLLMTVWSEATGEEPWWSGGTAETTWLLRDIRGDDAGAEPRDLVEYHGGLVFTADDGIHGRELWRSDATEAGTVLIADVRSGAEGSKPNQLIVFDDAVFFVADDGISGTELWRTDGTPIGTYLVADVRPGRDGSAPDRFAIVGDRLFFYADDGVHGRELWCTDGTREGTRLVRDIQPGPGGSDVYDTLGHIWPMFGDSAVWRGKLYFPADDGMHGPDLWRSDGTEGGTELVVDLETGMYGYPRDLFVAGDRLFFSLIAGYCPCEWETDGTPEGTHRLSSPFCSLWDAVTVDAITYAIGDEAVWRFDPSDGWTAVAPDVEPYWLFQAGGELFALNDYAPLWRQGFGFLWPREGSWPGRAFSDFVAFDDRILLYDERDEAALWATDGTGDGTYRVQLLPEPEYGRRDYSSSNASWFTRAGDHVFFAARTGEIGSELWALPIDVLPGICLDCPMPTPTNGVVPTPTCTGSCEQAHGDSGCQVSPCTGRVPIPWALGIAFSLIVLRTCCPRRWATEDPNG